MPSTSASDGYRIWTEDPGARAVTVSSPGLAGTWPGTESSLKRFTVWESLSDVLRANFHCVEPVRRSDEHIAGRPVYVLEFGQDQCRRPKSRPYPRQSRLLDGRIVAWIDQETLFMLRAEQYEFDHPDHLILSWYVTAIRYNVPLDPALFRLTAPPGYELVHER